MLMIEVIDNFLENYYIDYLLELIDNPFWMWRYHKNISYKGLDVEDSWKHGFEHLLFSKYDDISFDMSNSQVWIPLFLKIEEYFNLPVGSLFRARLDMTLRSPENTIHTPHVDHKFFHYASILYLNDSDGDTIFFNEKIDADNSDCFPDCSDLTVKKIVSPKKNRLIFFDGSYFHTGHSPSNNNRRILLNANYHGNV
jgi:hypothetical protein